MSVQAFICRTTAKQKLHVSFWSTAGILLPQHPWRVWFWWDKSLDTLCYHSSFPWLCYSWHFPLLALMLLSVQLQHLMHEDIQKVFGLGYGTETNCPRAHEISKTWVKKQECIAGTGRTRFWLKWKKWTWRIQVRLKQSSNIATENLIPWSNLCQLQLWYKSFICPLTFNY